MKKTLVTLAIVLLAVAAQAQIKMHNDGQVSLGSLTKNYGVQAKPNGLTYFRAQSNQAYSIATRGLANHEYQKHWVVNDYTNGSLGEDNFFVYGKGKVCAYNYYIFSENESRAEKEYIDGEEALATVLQLTGYYRDENNSMTLEEIMSNEFIDEEAKEEIIKDLVKRNVSLAPESLLEAFPDAIRTDPQNRKYIDYQAVVTILVEAFKEQQHEIEELRGILEENGLLK
jgi:hypothetical protein